MRIWALLVVFICLPSAGFTVDQKTMLQQPADVEKVMDLILNQHVDKHKLNEDVIRKSFLVYINQFDPYRTYFLDSEAAPYINMRKADAKRILAEYRNHDFSAYEKLDRLIQQAIRRARNYRVTLDGNDLALSKSFRPSVEWIKGEEENNVGFAKSLDELRARQRQQVTRFIEEERNRFGDVVAEKKKDRLLSIYEGQLRAQENQYLYLTSDDLALSSHERNNLFYMHVLKSLAHSLDQHTSVFNQEEAYDMRVRLEKGFEGIGIVLKRNLDGYFIKRLLPDSPAFNSGKLSVNDMLVAVDGHQVADMPVDEVMQFLRGKQGTPVSLQIRQTGSPPSSEKLVTVNLKREKIIVHEGRVETDFEAFGDGIIGMIKLHAFYQGNGISSEKDVRDAINELDKQGKLRGLILDLRDNSGGFLTQAVKVAGLFITNGVVVISKYSDGEEHYYRDMDGKISYKGPLIVLTSQQTASAAEIVAQALQDYGVAVVVGDEQTYGKGTIQSQTVTSQEGGSYFKVTVGKYYTVSGKTPEAKGVRADILVPGFGKGAKGDYEFSDYAPYEDTISPSFRDTLADIDPGLRPWYMRYYVPTLQVKNEQWKQLLPELRNKSQLRISNNLRYQKFLQGDDSDLHIDILRFEDVGDPQLHEAVNIAKDMIILEDRDAVGHQIGEK